MTNERDQGGTRLPRLLQCESECGLNADRRNKRLVVLEIDKSPDNA